MKPRLFSTARRSFALASSIAALLAGPSALADNTWDGGAGGSFLWNNNINWGLDTAPSYGTLTFSGSTGTTNVNDSITSMNGLLWTGTSAWTLNNSGGTILSLFDNGGIAAKIENQSTGLVTINAPITFAATAGQVWGEINAVNGGLTFGSGTLTVNGSGVNYIKMFGGGQTTTFNNTVSATGKAFYTTSGSGMTMAVGGAFTSGDIFIMNGSTLRLNSGGSITTSQLRLGGDFGTTLTQNQALGATFALTNASGGQSFSSGINTVSGNTSNALLIDSQNTSGTNTISSAIALDSGLKVQQASGGSLTFSGGSINIKNLTLTVQGAGTTTINEVLSSSLTAGGSLVKTGAGTLILQGIANTYTGTAAGTLNANGTQINQGTLGIYGDASLGLAPTSAYNNIQFTGSATLQNTANNITLATTRNISIAAGATATFDSLGNTFTIPGVISGATGVVTKIGTGTLTLNGAAVNTFAGGLNANGGTLTLDYTNLATPTNLINSGNALQINNGTLTITGKNVAAATTVQTFASTSLGAGRNTINIAKGALATSATINLGALTANTGSVTVFSPTTAWTTAASTTEIVKISAGGNVSIPGSGTAFANAGIFHRAAGGAVGSLRLAAVNTGTGQLLLKANAGNLATTTGVDPTGSYQLAAGSIALTGPSTSVYGLLLNATGAGTNITVPNSGTLTLNSVIQIKATESVNIIPGTGVSNVVIGAERNLVFAMDNAAAVGVSAPIVNNGGGASGVTIFGSAPSGTPGGVSLSGVNTYTGSTSLRNGILTLGNVNALGTIPGVNGTSGISMDAGSLLQSNTTGGSTIAAPITLSGVGNTNLRIGQGAASTTHTFTINGAIGGATGNLVYSTSATSFSNGSSLFVLGAAGTYTGNTLITTGNGGNNPVFLQAGTGIVNALPVTTVLTFNGDVGGGTGRTFQYDMNGNAQTLAGLTNTVASLRRQIFTNSGSLATLTINNATDMSFGGSDLTTGSTNRAQLTGAIALTKSGAGTFTLGGTLLGGATVGGNTHTGETRITAGILVLGETISLQNSPFNTGTSVLGDATNGLRSSVTALTLGGLTGGNNFSTRFTTTTGGYTGLTGLTLNPGTGVTHTYSGDVGNGNGSMTLTKSGAGTQVLTNTQTNTGATSINAGTLQLDGSTHVSSTVAIGTAGTLTGTGTVNGNATLIGGGIINKSAGAIAGTLGVTGGNWNGAGAVTGLVTSSSGTFTIGSGANLTANGDLSVTGGSISAVDATSAITGSVNYTSSSNSTFAGNITGSSKTLTMNGAAATLTLSGTNGYTGATLVNNGTLTLSGTGAINGSSGITVSGIGAKFLQTSSVAASPTVTLTQGTLTGNGTVNTVNVGAGTGGIISNNNGVAGASLTIGALTFNGAATVNTFSDSTSAPIVTTTLASNAAGIVTINPTAASWTNGATYNLISYVGTIGGAGFGQFTKGTVAGLLGRQSAGALVDNVGSAITMTISGDYPVWSGVGTQTWTTATNGDNTGPNDWALLTGQTATNFWAADEVRFNDTYNLGAGDVAVTNTTVTITGGVAPSTTTFNNSAVNYTINSSDATGITAGTVTLNGTGTVTISTVNSYTGATIINAGTLSLTGSLTGGTAITTSGSGILNVGPTGVISGAASITQGSSGTSILSGTNTYTGGTSINAGTLTISGSGTLGTGSALTLGGGQLDLGATSQTVGAVSVTAPAASGDTIGNGSLTGTSYAASNTTGNAIISANLLVNGAAGFAKSGAGTVTLSGTNTFTGATSISGGTVIMANTQALGLPAANITLNGATLDIATAGGDTAYNFTTGSGSIATIVSDVAAGTTGINHTMGTMNIGGSASAGGTQLNITAGAGITSGTPAITFGAVTLGAGVTNVTTTFNPTTARLSIGSVTTASTTTGTKTLNLDGTATGNEVTGVISNAGGTIVAVSKTNTGTWTLGGANTYTAATTVTVGTLTLSGNRTVSTATTTGSYTVAGAGTQTLNIQNGTYGIGGSFVVANNGGTATVNHSAGSITSVGGSGLILANGSVAGTTAIYNLSGTGALTVANIIMGTNSGASAASPNTSTIAVSDTGALTATTLRIGRYDTAGNINTTNTFTQTGGTTTITNLGLGGNTANASNSAGPIIANLNLTGGVFSATNFASLSAGGAASALDANSSFINIGGTAQVTLGAFPTARGTNSTATITFDSTMGGGGFLSPAVASAVFMPAGTFTNAYLTANGANFNVPTLKDITIGQVLENAVSPAAAGTLTKSGVGALTLTGASTYTGGTTLNQGTLTIGTGGTLGASTGALAVNNNSTAAGTNAVLNLATAVDTTTGTLSGTIATPISGTNTATINNGGSGRNFTVNQTAAGSYAGVIAGTGSFTLGSLSTNTLTLIGANTYSGTTTISAGTLQLGAGSTTGSLSASSAIVNNANLTINRNNAVAQGTDFSSAAITGTGSFTQAGTGTTTMNVANSYTGTTTISNGTLQLGAGSTTGSLSASSAIVNNGNLTINRSNAVAQGTDFSGADITGSGSFTQAGTGTTTLNVANSYSGTTTVSGGTLEVRANDALGITAAGTSVAAGAALKLTGVNYSTAEALSLNGTGVEGGGALVNSGTSIYAGQITAATNASISAGGGTLNLTGGLVKNGTTLTLTGGGTINVSGTGISGSNPNSDLVVDGVTVNQNVANDYNGPTYIRSTAVAGTGILNANVTDALPTANGRTAVTMDDSGLGSSNLTLGATQSAASLTGAASSTIALGSNTLTVGASSGSTTFAGVISGTNGNLTKDTAGSTQVLTGVNTYTGTTTINAGTLEAGGAGALGATTSIVVNTGGTLLLSGSGDLINNSATVTLAGGTFNTGGVSETLGTLTLTDDSIIDFGGGASTLSFANSTGLWTTGKTLSIWNWSGNPVNGGGTDQLRFASNGLDTNQLAQINFYSGPGTGQLSITPGLYANGFVSFGEVVPVPEPSSVATVMGLLGLVGWRERRKARFSRAAERRAIA